MKASALARESELIESFGQILKEAHFPYELKIRKMDWQRTPARPYGVEMSILATEKGGLPAKPREVLLSCAAQWREKHWPGWSVEKVDELGIYITIHVPIERSLK